METTHTQNREELVRQLVRDHFDLEDGIERIVWFQNGDKEPDVRLIEVNRNSIVTGSFDAFYFASSADFPLPIQIADVTPEEWEKIQRRELQLPTDWTLDKIKVFERACLSKEFYKEKWSDHLSPKISAPIVPISHHD